MRARNIKPGFFENEDLADCHPLARILFAGLWCMADRAGRLEDRPKRIKAKILPYDECSIDELLDQLQEAGFIRRYKTGGGIYIQIDNFLKHQNPHQKEAASEIPAPEEHHTSTVQEQEKHEKDRADSGFRIPDSHDSGSRIQEEDSPTGPAAQNQEEDPYVCCIPTQREDRPLRILQSQADKWQAQFRFVDVYGELGRLETWASNLDPPKRWKADGAFMACSQAINKANQREMHEYHKRDPTFDPTDPDGSKKAEADIQRTQEMINQTSKKLATK